MATFRLPGSAYLAVVFLALCVTPLVTRAEFAVVYVVPVLAAAFIARSATIVDSGAITVRAILRSERLTWEHVRGLVVREDKISVSLDDGTVVRLPYVRVRHLAVLSQASDGRVPAPQ